MGAPLDAGMRVVDVVAALRERLGERVRTEPVILASHRRDTWVLSELRDLEGRPGPLPLAVVEVRSSADVSQARRVCRAQRTPVVPYGGGSGVCGGVAVPEGAIVLSTERMTGLVELDARNLTATFLAGTNGMEAERLVEREGLTIGHWPQSIDVSSVGGWVATRASGQYSTGYGSIEDLVLDLEAVLPDGSVLRTRRTPRASTGPDLRQIFLGSEGIFGVITEVTFSLRPLPEASRGQAFHFESLAAGVEPIRLLMRAGWRPPVVRLYDALESARHFPGACPEERAMLILLHEGPASLVEAQRAAVGEICASSGGAEADAAVVDGWLATRNDVPGFRPFLEKGIILDTIEVACTWSRVAELYERAVAALSEVPGILLASAHSSHSYRSGTNLYITFAARPEKPEQMAETYRECWRRTLDASLAVGGGISHHHGIGRVRRERLGDEIGEAGVALLWSLKRALDPDGLLNPGVLLPGGADRER
jgi:alkyldihydroxyacetonephosphate synthase